MGFPCVDDPPPNRGPETAPFVECGVGVRSFAEKTLCRRVGRAWRYCGGPGGARESRSKRGHTETGIAVNIQSDTTTTFMSVFYIVRLLKQRKSEDDILPRCHSKRELRHRRFFQSNQTPVCRTSKLVPMKRLRLCPVLQKLELLPDWCSQRRPGQAKPNQSRARQTNQTKPNQTNVYMNAFIVAVIQYRPPQSSRRGVWVWGMGPTM